MVLRLCCFPDGYHIRDDCLPWANAVSYLVLFFLVLMRLKDQNKTAPVLPPSAMLTQRAGSSPALGVKSLPDTDLPKSSFIFP